MIVLVAGLTAAAGLFTFYRTDPVAAKSERVVTDVLAEARAALIGYAVRRGGATGTARPGELPCPDSDGDGIENAPCSSTGSLLGRLPWKTLGISELRDSAGETLWYALAPTFRDWNSMAGWTTVQRRLNSDTRGTITVRGPDGANVTTEAVAVVFSPGASLGAQSRSGIGAVMCALIGNAVSRQRCATNYLDSALGVNNAGSASGPFIQAAPNASFNDRLIHLTAQDIMPAVEMRIGGELKALLQAYRSKSNCKCYPWADNWPYSGGIADTGQNRGRFPSLPEPELWGQNGIPALPQWLATNDWHNLFWYTVGRQNTDMHSDIRRRCRTCSDHPLLRVTDTVKNELKWVSALLFTPGPPLDGIARLAPPKGYASRTDNIELYVEDPENRVGALSKLCPDVGEIGGALPPSGNFKGVQSCDEYVVPRAKALNRDRLITVGVADPAVCAPNAQVLLNTICHTTGTDVEPACTTAVHNLDACPCLQGARAMLEVPCRNTHSAAECQEPLQQLQVCAKL